jgi:hypothetical protein
MSIIYRTIQITVQYVQKHSGSVQCFLRHLQAEERSLKGEIENIFKDNVPIYMLFKMKGLIPKEEYNEFNFWVQASMDDKESAAYEKYLELEENLTTARSFIAHISKLMARL